MLTPSRIGRFFVDTNDQDTVLQMILERAQSRLDGQSRDSDAMDLKALGVLAANAAALGVLIAVHSSINGYWWLPAAGLGLGGLLLLIVAWPRDIDMGPDWRDFYSAWGGSSAYDAGRQMLSELLDAIERNDANARKFHGKALLFKIGFVLTVTAVMAAGIMGYER